MSVVTVYRFEVWHDGEWVLSTRMATRDSIEKYGNYILYNPKGL